MEDAPIMSKSGRMSDKQQLFKIKSKPQRQTSQANAIAFDTPQLPVYNNNMPVEAKPVYEKAYVADAKGKLTSLRELHHKEELQ